MYITEPFIHFAHLPINITHQQAEFYLRWALHAREFTITIWTVAGREENITDSLAGVINDQRQMNNTGRISKRVSAEGFTLVVESVTYAQRDRVSEILSGNIVDRYEAPQPSSVPPIVINVFKIETLPPISNPQLVHEEISMWENNRAATNFLRLWILHEYGGIFLDNFVHPTGQMVYPSLPAPHGILFHIHNVTPPILTNAIIASSQRNPKLKEIAQFMTEFYKYEYVTSHTGELKLSKGGNRKFSRLEHWRQQLPDSSQKQGRKGKIAQRKINAIQTSRLMAKGDVRILNYWIDNVEGLFDEADRLAARQDYAVIDISAEGKEAHIRDYEMEPYAEYQNYSFETMTGYTFHMKDTFFVDPITLPRRFFWIRQQNVSTASEEFDII